MFLYICAVEDWNVISTWLGGGLYKATMYLLWETYDWDILLTHGWAACTYSVFTESVRDSWLEHIINTWMGSLYKATVSMFLEVPMLLTKAIQGAII